MRQRSKNYETSNFEEARRTFYFHECASNQSSWFTFHLIILLAKHWFILKSKYEENHKGILSWKFGYIFVPLQLDRKYMIKTTNINWCISPTTNDLLVQMSKQSIYNQISKLCEKMTSLIKIATLQSQTILILFRFMQIVKYLSHERRKNATEYFPQ